MIVYENIKERLSCELEKSKQIWIASAMISRNGWNFLQTHIPAKAIQNLLIGIDLSTEPSVFQSILENLEFNARVYEDKYTFHPKVYIIEKENSELLAFIGSSNTTNWGLEKNTEMNFLVTDQIECKKLILWFENLFRKGHIISEIFLKDYKDRFQKTISKIKEIEIQINEVKSKIIKDNTQFFNRNQHEIFKEKYHRVETNNLKEIRKTVRAKFLEIHNNIYPRFKEFQLDNLHCHHQTSKIVSTHYFNAYSGKSIDAMWLHYGKSKNELQNYNENPFINNIRLQVIIRQDTIGLWLVLGKKMGVIKIENILGIK